MDENELATMRDERLATLGDGTRLRITPKGQPTVDELVYPGDIIQTNYDTGGKVTQVHRYSCYGLSVYTIVYTDPDTKPNKNGSYRSNALGWINECVAQDGRILKLFVANEDEVFVKKKVAIRQLKFSGQQSLKWFSDSASKPTGEG